MSGFGLYVHWPFCLSKCPYCDFNSHVRDQVDQVRWKAALLAELAHWAEKTPDRQLDTIFFGGGTPSLMPPETAGAVIEAAKSHWTPSPDLEVTLEANPTSVEAEKLSGFRDAGVGRVSLGIQALNDADLARLGRTHSARDALRALEIARERFERISFDLIYARPEQSLAQWREELARALELSAGHLSLYQLTIEKRTVFELAYARGELKIPGEDAAADLYEATQDMTEAAGLPAYEISNHAAPGAECRHNLIYWRYGDYAGIGPGAHGRLTLGGEKYATRVHRAPEAWLKRVEEDGHAIRTFEPIPREIRAEESLMMGLRLAEGASKSTVETEAGRGFDDIISASRRAALIEEGLLGETPSRITATKAGRQRLDSVLGYLLAGPQEGPT
jgi:oxygen-independent coproporphyrinogen-3 oxidase